MSIVYRIVVALALALVPHHVGAAPSTKDLSIPTASCLFDNFMPWEPGFSLVCSQADLEAWAALRSLTIAELTGVPPGGTVPPGIYEAADGEYAVLAPYAHDAFIAPPSRTREQVRAAYLGTLGVSDAEAHAGSPFTPAAGVCGTFQAVGSAETQYSGAVRLYRYCGSNPSGPYAGRTVLYIEGHGGSFADVAMDQITWLAGLGFEVYAADMPLFGSNAGDPEAIFGSHSNYRVLEGASVSPLWSELLAPYVSIVNHLRSIASGPLGAMGRSGGGMIAQGLGTLHEHVDYVVSVAGATPLSMRLAAGPFEVGDWEQWSPRTYSIVGHEELIRSAGRLGGLYAYGGQDFCCFRVAVGDGFYEWMQQPTDDGRLVGLAVDPLQADHGLSEAQKPAVLAFINMILASPVLGVSIAVEGTGSVVSTPGGIDCGTSCAATFNAGAVVTLEAVPEVGYVLAGWSAAECPGTGTCTLTMSASQVVTATFTQQGHPLSVAVTGSGAVTSEPAGIDCGLACSHEFGAGTVVTLSPAPAPGYAFTGWSGDGCSGTEPCTVAMDMARSVTAMFDTQAMLSISKSGSGSGSVGSVPAGIECGLACIAPFSAGTSVTLTATPAAGSVFVGWTGGGCSGTDACMVTMDASKSVIAVFEVQLFALSVAKAGPGGGSVGSVPAGIDCGPSCSAPYPAGALVTLTATPDLVSLFIGWTGGGCGGTGACVVTMDAARTVTAVFEVRLFALLATKTGSGSGSVGSVPAGIDCGPACGAPYPAGTSVALTATPAVGSVFTGWTGAGCSGTGACVVTMDAARTVTAAFERQQFLLSVSRSGSGRGSVSSAPAGIGCGFSCAALYDFGAAVTLTATPAVGSVFMGWTGGGCSGTGACVVTMDAARTVTAMFDVQLFALSVVKSGSGSGSVGSLPAGIDCGPACGTPYPVGTPVTLTATPAAGSLFIGWTGGGCGGTGACVVTMDASRTVAAIFEKQQPALSVTKSGSGSGSVSSAPAGISCGSACTGNFDYGATVTLTATPAVDSLFIGWTGGSCGGSGACVVTIDTARTVTAVFEKQQFALSVSKSGSGSGSVSSAPAGIACGSSCTGIYDYGATVTLTPTPGAGSVFLGWEGDCAGTAACQLVMSAAHSVDARFGIDPDPPRLANLSARALVLTGDRVMIAGFVIGGASTKTVAIVATGPSLKGFGLTNALANPKLTLVRQSDHAVIAANDDWATTEKADKLLELGYAPSDPLEAAIIAELPPGAYTAILEGAANTTGIGVVGLYEVGQPDAPLLNISARALVQGGNEVVIGGFVVQGSGPRKVAIVAVGPSLSQHGIANPLPNTYLSVVRASDNQVIAVNGDWQLAASAAALQEAGLQPSHPLESAMILTLEPGAYTAILQDANLGSGGVAVISVYQVD